MITPGPFSGINWAARAARIKRGKCRLWAACGMGAMGVAWRCNESRSAHHCWTFSYVASAGVDHLKIDHTKNTHRSFLHARLGAYPRRRCTQHKVLPHTMTARYHSADYNLGLERKASEADLKSDYSHNRERTLFRHLVPGNLHV